MIAFEYAKAFYELSENKDAILEELEKFIEVLDLNKDFEKFLSTPRISYEEKRSLLNKCLNGFSPKSLSFFDVLIKNDRMSLIKEIKEQFLNLYLENSSSCQVIIKSSSNLTENQKEEIIKKINNVYPNMIIIPTYLVDNDLKVGYVIYIGSSILDLSLVSRMRTMKECL